MRKLCREETIENCERLKACLEAAGVPCEVRHETSPSLFAGDGDAASLLPELWVRNDDDFERAWGILNADRTAEDEGAVGSDDESAPPRRRPNILVVMTDHTNALAVSPGGPCLTPNVDRLAAEGLRFARAHTTNAICSPARASLMTGLFPSAHGIWDCTHTQRREWVDLPAGRFPFFSERLSAAGYRGAYFGKWHVEQSQDLRAFGWQEFDADCGSLRVARAPGSSVGVATKGYPDYVLAAEAQAADGTHPAFDRGIEFIRRHVAAHRQPDGGLDQPFCCFVSTSEPHDPYVPLRRYAAMYPPERVPLSPTLRDAPEGKPEIVRRMRDVWAALSDADWQRVTAAYRAVVSFLDHELGRILEVLREEGRDRDTIVVFTSDHGDMLGAHGLAAKGVGTPYEEVYNIPLVLRVPGLTRGGENDWAAVSLVDVAPTLLDLCGVAPLGGTHGRTLRPVLDGSARREDWSDGYAEFFAQRFMYTQRIVWHGPWKYVFSPGGIDELYDLEADPHERVNRAGDPNCRTILEDMARRMWRRMEALDDQSLLRSPYATLRTAPVGPERSGR